jgi:putative transposase
MRRLDELHLDKPFMGTRMLGDQPARMNIKVGGRRIRTLIKRMGIAAVYRKPRTSTKHPGHKVYPYLLRA